MKVSAILAATVALSPLMAMAQDQGTVEGLHHWVSESEVAALNVIVDGLKAKGFAWEDSAVGGMSGANAQQTLRTRLAAGNPPGAVQLVGYEGLDWAAEGALRNLSELEGSDGWKAALAPQLLPFVEYEGQLVVLPINMHRQNWVWANKAAFEKAGVAQPTTWAELIAAGPKFKEAGIIPLATGDEAWQIQVLFDAIAADVGGPEFYNAAFVELDEAALSSDTMKEVFDTLRGVRGLVDDGFNGRDWAVATNMVIEGQAAMQVMGDWAKGEFLAKGLKPDVDFLCFATPAAEPSFLFNADGFGMFVHSDENVTAAQSALAEVLMDPKVQHDFNVLKGSIPARNDVVVDDMDACAQKGFAERAAAMESGRMLGALTHGFAAEPRFTAVFGDVASEFFVTEMTSEEAVQMLVDGINNAR